MAQQTINIGIAPNTNTGDPIRTAFTKVNNNFTELYTFNLGQTAGSTTQGFVNYSATTKTAGQFYGGTTAPDSTTRLNFDGHVYATKFFGDGSGLTGAGATVTDDTTTDAARYLLFDDITTGSATSISVSSTKLTFNPSSGLLSSTALNLSGGTANGVLYLDGSKVATSGSALTFDGTNLGMSSGASVSIGGNVSLYGDANQTVVRGRVTNGIIFQASDGSEQMRLTSTGLGIGTTPEGKLHAVTSGSSSQYLFDSTITSGTFGFAIRSTGESGSAHPILGIAQWRSSFPGNQNVGQIRFDGLTTAGTYTTFAEIYAVATSANSTTGAATSLAFRTSDGTGQAQERMVLTSSGNLGIGTSSPATRLEVVGSQANWRRFSTDTAPFYFPIIKARGVVSTPTTIVAGDAIGAFQFYGYTGSNELPAASITGRTESSGTISSTSMPGAIDFATTPNGASVPVTRMTLDSSGNLGLGVTPSAWQANTKAIDIGSGSAIWNPGSDTQTQILTNAYNNGTNFIFKGTGSASRYRMTGGQHEWYSSTASGTAGNTISFGDAKMTLDVSGNLILGTTSGSNRLVVTGADASTGGVAITGTGTGGLKLYYDHAGGGNAYINNTQNGFMWFGTNNTERARITSGGDLLVGTTSVQTFVSATETTLTIKGNAANKAAALSLVNASGDCYGGIGVGEVVDSLYLGANTNHPVVFLTNNTERARITSGGNFLIGTQTDGGYKLEVNGSFAATTKSFVINHPTKPGKKLRYGSLEGPENGVYVRGKLKGSTVIELPGYWTKLVDPESITVNLTPIGNHQNLYVEEVVNNTIIIKNSNLLSKEVNCYYTVYAERIDVEKLQVEI